VRVLFSVIILVALAGIASAASVDVTPTSIYETTTVWQTADVDNYGANAVVGEVDVTSPLAVKNVKHYNGWSATHTSTTAEWTGGSIETNTASALFEFQVSAPNVSSDESKTLTVSLDGQDFLFNITVLNDATPPNISNLTPSAYARANNSAQTIKLAATDDETGVASVSYSFDDCQGGPDTTVSLSRLNNQFTGTADFSGFDEGDEACYTITATNNAGETGTTTGTLKFDGTAPSVSLFAPTTYVTEQTTYSFTASDNIAASLACTVYLGANALGSVDVANGSNASVTHNTTNVSEGSNTWGAQCEDGVGLTASNQKAIVVDTLAPSISLAVDETIPRTTNANVVATVTDANLDSVAITVDNQTANHSVNGDDYTTSFSRSSTGTVDIEIVALDLAGHQTIVTQTVTIVPNHQVSASLSPATTTQGTVVTVSGSVTADSNLTNGTVTVETPTGDKIVALNGSSYTTTFTAPSQGTYDVTVKYIEQGHTYSDVESLTVQANNNNDDDDETQQSFSHGTGFDSWRQNGGLAPDEEQESSNSELDEEPAPSEPEPEEPEPEEYEPIDPEEPRQATTPKATGVFTLGNAVKWLSILAVLGGLLAGGVYAYRRRHPKKENIDWDAYFQDGPGTNN